MKTIIIALSGKKSAGKNTLSSFIRDYFAKKWYKGDRSIPFCKEFAFADLLKEFCIETLGLSYSQCYGTDEEKNTPTIYPYLINKWPRSLAEQVIKEGKVPAQHLDGFMTGREVMQNFGTECIRHWFGNVWAQATLRRIQKCSPALAIINDCRFSNEVESILNYPNGHIIRLTRSPYNDNHASEISLDSFDFNQNKCYILNNAKLLKKEQEEAITPILDQIFQTELKSE